MAAPTMRTASPLGERSMENGAFIRACAIDESPSRGGFRATGRGGKRIVGSRAETVRAPHDRGQAVSCRKLVSLHRVGAGLHAAGRSALGVRETTLARVELELTEEDVELHG